LKPPLIFIQKNDEMIERYERIFDKTGAGGAEDPVIFTFVLAPGERPRAILKLLSGGYSGSVCGGSLGGRPVSTIGCVPRHVPAFQIGDEAEFERFMLKDIVAPPPHAAKLHPADAGIAMAPG
jgi:hypothetical protein